MSSSAFKVSSFTAVGHLLHINLKDHLLQYKNQIGEALLAKNPRALAVVNKLNTIDNEYRNFDIEVIAKRQGCDKSDEELMIVEVNENKCRFKLDFSKVYWNSRLCTEHERIINKLNKSIDIVFDLFAGVGPFAVPAAKAKCKTYANDLNPESARWLAFNMKYNKIHKDMYELSNIDAKDYIQNNLKEKLLSEYQRIDDEELATKPTIHIIMNLPALATTFLPYFVGLFKEEAKTKYMINSNTDLVSIFKEQNLTHIIHCYCFLKGVFDEPKLEVRKLVETDLGRKLNDDQILDIFRVRNVAPYKEMYRVDIRLDGSLLFDPKQVISTMRSACSNKPTSNGNCKKVTIQAPKSKRAHEEVLDESSEIEAEDNCKRLKSTSYCSVI